MTRVALGEMYEYRASFDDSTFSSANAKISLVFVAEPSAISIIHAAFHGGVGCSIVIEGHTVRIVCDDEPSASANPELPPAVPRSPEGLEIVEGELEE